MVLGVAGTVMKSATYTRRIKNSREIVGVSTVTFGSKNEPTPYRTHWVSPKLSERRRESLNEKVSRAPDLVVIQPLNRDWVCHRCGGTGELLTMEPAGPACLRHRAMG
jgi:hypothetical protein